MEVAQPSELLLVFAANCQPAHGVYAVLLLIAGQCAFLTTRKPWCPRKAASSEVDGVRPEAIADSKLAPPNVLLVYRLLAFVYATTVGGAQLYVRGLRALKFYTVWNWWLLVTYFLISAVTTIWYNSTKHADRTHKRSWLLGRLAHAAAILFHINMTMVALVDSVAWFVLYPAALRYQPDASTEIMPVALLLSFYSINQHGVNAGLLFLDLLLNAIPLRIHMFGYVGIWSLLFLGWANIYHASTGKWLYPFLNTTKTWAPAAYLALYGAHWGFFLLAYYVALSKERLTRGRQRHSTHSTLVPTLSQVDFVEAAGEALAGGIVSARAAGKLAYVVSELTHPHLSHLALSGPPAPPSPHHTHHLPTTSSHAPSHPIAGKDTPIHFATSAHNAPNVDSPLAPASNPVVPSLFEIWHAIDPASDSPADQHHKPLADPTASSTIALNHSSPTLPTHLSSTTELMAELTHPMLRKLTNPSLSADQHDDSSALSSSGSAPSLIELLRRQRSDLQHKTCVTDILSEMTHPRRSSDASDDESSDDEDADNEDEGGDEFNDELVAELNDFSAFASPNFVSPNLISPMFGSPAYMGGGSPGVGGHHGGLFHAPGEMLHATGLLKKLQ